MISAALRTLGVIGLTAALSTPVEARAEMRRYALVIANNYGVDEDLEPLSFADDDGAKYYELFTAMGAQVELFAVLDAAAQNRFPRATEASRAPKHETLWPVLDGVFEDMRAAHAQGHETTFFFVYAGHGSLGPNREGYLHLLDGKLRRRDIYAKVIARSPATWNHLIIDACNAYFVVEKRGEATHTAAVQRFLRKEDLRSYPNTGVILAASTESETHEWSRWGAGVFSHELRSALLGGADVDGNGAITYAEAAYSVEAANSAVSDPRARLRVYARPPPSRINAPLVELDAMRSPRLQFEAPVRGHHYVHDARGVRVVDLHPDGEGRRDVALVGEAPFRLVTPSGEATIPNEPAVRVAQLTPVASATSHRGNLEDTYRKHLFAKPYGHSFLEGALSSRGADAEDWDGWYGSTIVVTPTINILTDPITPWTIGAASSLSVAVAAGVASSVLYWASGQSYTAYLEATAPSDIRALRERTEAELATAHTLLGVSIVAAAAGITILVFEWSSGDDAVALAASANGVFVTGRF